MFENKEYINLEKIRQHDSGKTFDVPEGYFDRMQAQVLSKTAGNGFTLPDAYFDTLKGRIESRVAPPDRWQPILLIGGKNWMSMAAASLIAISSLVLWLNFKTPAYVARLNELSDDEIIHYVVKEDLHDEGLLELATKVDEKHTDQTEQYLLNTADTDLIMEEL
jgi:hypothetical protein